jgi:hypothetical protein
MGARTVKQIEAIPVNVDLCSALPVGAEFTIHGVKLLPTGRFITDCKPGEETRLVNSGTIESIYKLRSNEPKIAATHVVQRQHGPAKRKKWD